MARKPAKAAASLPDPEAAPEPQAVREVSTREFRANLRAIIEAGEPVIIRAGRSISGIFFPLDFHAWWNSEERPRKIAKLRRDFPSVVRAVETR